jgi:LppX_LprAFG lipoprotein
MHPSRATLAALLTFVVVALAGCGGGAAASPISDPTAILTQSIEAARAAKTVHVKVDVAGKVPIGDLSGLLAGGLSGIPGGSAAPTPSSAASASGASAGLDLTGTTAEGDLDFADTAAHIAFAAPALLGVTGDLIAVDGAAYLKVSLLGDKYQKLDETPGSTASPGASLSPSGSAASPLPTAGMVDSLKTALGQLKTPPTKLADEQCGDTTCYHVRVTLDQSTTSALESLAPGVTGTGTVDVWVRQNDLRPSQIVIKGDSGTAAGMTVTATFSDWDKAVSIQAPPADQVTSGGSLLPSFSIPSFAIPSPSG